MFNTIRKNQRILMLIIVILTILAFTLFYTHTNSVTSRTGEGVGSIYGKVILQERVDRLVENYQLANVLGLHDLLESLGGVASNENVALTNFVFNQLVIEHEAKALGIEPRDDQVARAITERPIFQTDGHFDVEKYRVFIKSQLIPRGIRERQLEELVRDSLRVANIRKIVTGSVAVSDQEIRNAFRGYQKQDLLLVTFSLAECLNKVQIPEEQVRLLYEKNLADLNSPETRTARYVVFEVPKEKNALQEKERVKAIQTVANQAAAFAESLSNNKVSLAEAANKAGLAVNTTLPFDQKGSGAEAENFYGNLPNLAPSIFKLTQQQPHSEALEGSQKTRFYVFELASINPPRPLTFEEAHPQLLNTLRNQAANKLLYEEGYAALASISKDMRAGKSFLEAAIDAGGKVQAVPRTALYSSASPEDALYNEVALFLSPGQVSALQPSVDGAFAVYVQRRDAVNNSELAQKSDFLKAQILKNKQALLFLEWLHSAQKEANIRMNQRGA